MTTAVGAPPKRAEQLPFRVVQWTTGNIGTESVHAIVENSLLELVGCYAWSPDKVGRDVGELCGIDPLGVLATDDVAALIALITISFQAIKAAIANPVKSLRTE